MSCRKNGLRGLGLCVIAALGLMAFTAASAQAEAGGLWLYLFTPGGVSHDIPSGIGLGVTLEKHVLLESTVGGTKISILCQKLTTTDGLILAEGRGLAKLELAACGTSLNGTPNGSCTPAEPISATVRTLPILHNSKTYVVIEVDPQGMLEETRLAEEAEEKFVVVSLGAGCVVGNKFTIKGLLPIKECGANSLETHLFTHLVEEAQSLFAGQLEGGKILPTYQLKFGVNAMSLLGSVNLNVKEPFELVEWGLVS